MVHQLPLDILNKIQEETPTARLSEALPCVKKPSQFSRAKAMLLESKAPMALTASEWHARNDWMWFPAFGMNAVIAVSKMVEDPSLTHQCSYDLKYWTYLGARHPMRIWEL